MNNSKLYFNYLLIGLATICSLPFWSFYVGMAGLYLLATLHHLISNDRETMLSMWLLWPLLLPIDTIFSQASTYLLLSGVGLLFAICGFFWHDSSRRAKGWSVLMGLTIVMFPFVLRYQPALTAAPGYHLDLVTEPGFFGGTVKAAQSIAELEPCAYTPLFWDSDNRLYYQAICEGTTQLWQYNPTSHFLQPVSMIPPNLSTTTISKNIVKTMVQNNSAGVDLSLKSNGYVSPNGQWVALVSQHVYGPQDVLVARKLNDVELQHVAKQIFNEQLTAEDTQSLYNNLNDSQRDVVTRKLCELTGTSFEAVVAEKEHHAIVKGFTQNSK